MADFSIFSPDGGTTALNVKDAKARNIVSDAFDSETSYNIGDYCIYEGALYKCTTAHTGAWNAADFTVTTIAEELKNASGGGSSSKSSFYGTCNSSSDTSAKIVTLNNTANWELKPGTIVGVKFTHSNAVKNVTLNINNTGNKAIWYDNSVYTENKSNITGIAGAVTYYMYDGTYWVWLSTGASFDEESLTKVLGPWKGMSFFDGSKIWTDGDNTYYSNTHVLDRATSTWIEKTWYGDVPDLSNYAKDIWTDGDNIYYSNNDTNQYVLDKATSTWSTKTWYGVNPIYGRKIWTDGNNIYYSYSTSSSDQWVLDKATSTWTQKTWTGQQPTGENVWTDGENIYYSSYSTQKVLDKATSTWSDKTWSGLTNFYGEYIWTNGSDVYYSEGYSKQRILDKTTSTWTSVSWNISSLNSSGTYLTKSDIWKDGDNTYYSKESSKECYVLSSSSANTWYQKAWSGINPDFSGQYVWTDGENIYYSYNKVQRVLDKTTKAWIGKEWNGYIPYQGNYIWTDGDNVYYSGGSNTNQYVLDKNTSTWSQKSWRNIPPTNFYSYNIWVDNSNNIRFSYAGYFYRLDRDTSAWVSSSISGMTYGFGQNIWTDGDNIYYTGAYRSTSGSTTDINGTLVLNDTSTEWTVVTWPGTLRPSSGAAIWYYGKQIYYDNNGTNSSDHIYLRDQTWNTMSWKGFTPIYPSQIWTDGEYTYYSYGTVQYILADSCSWLPKTGFNEIMSLAFNDSTLHMISQSYNLF